MSRSRKLLTATGLATAMTLLSVSAALAQPSPTASSEPETTPARVSAGKIPVLDFLRYLHVASGIPVLYPSDDPQFKKDVTIHVLEDSTLTIPLAKAMLDAHGYELVSKKLENGDQVLGVQHKRSRKVFENTVTPIYVDSTVSKDGVKSRVTSVNKQLFAMTVSDLVRHLEQGQKNPVLGAGQFTRQEPNSSPPTVMLPGNDPLEDEILLGLLAVAGIQTESMVLSNGSEVLLVSGRTNQGQDAIALFRLQNASPAQALKAVRARLRTNFVTEEEGEMGSFRYRAYEAQKALIVKGSHETVMTLQRLLAKADVAR